MHLTIHLKSGAYWINVLMDRGLYSPIKWRIHKQACTQNPLYSSGSFMRAAAVDVVDEYWFLWMSVCLSASAVWFCSMSHTQTGVALIAVCFFFPLMNGNAERGWSQEASDSWRKVTFSASHITEWSTRRRLELVPNNLVRNSMRVYLT